MRWLVAVCILSSLPIVGVAPKRARPIPSPWEAGLKAWRKPDARGQACSSCHSPDGIELAAYGFSPADIKRRGFAHLTGQDVEDIAAMIAAKRLALPKTSLLQNLVDRPLQPGGEVLPGATTADRDAAFAEQLAKLVPELVGTPINSLQLAQRLKSKLLSIDVRALRTGIPLNRLSEDGFHGSEHASLANWIPDLPVFAASDEAQDRYLADPSEANFRAVLPPASKEGVTTMVALSVAKARALAYLQDDLRHGRELATSTLPADVAWWVGEVAHSSDGFELSLLQSPDSAVAKKVNGPELRRQLADIRLAWFWLGWTLDPSLQRVSNDKAAQRGDYVSLSLWKDGNYPIHNLFLMTRRGLSEAFDPKAWVKTPPQRFTLLYGGFVNEDRARNGVTTKLGRQIASNALRMMLWLQIDECRTRGWVQHKDPILQQLRGVAGCLDAFAPEHKVADLSLVEETRKAIMQSGRPPGTQ